MKRLDSIIITNSQIDDFFKSEGSLYEHPYRSTVAFGKQWVSSALAPWKLPWNGVTSLIDSGGSVKYSAERTGIQYVCDNTTDLGTIQLGFVYLNSYPDAKKMLWHYLTGKGEEVEVPTERVLSESNHLKIFIFDTIWNDVEKGKKSGSINVRQGDYFNDNWKNAFGSINVKWIKSGEDIDIWIEDIYRWHPNEQRISQCVHQAMSAAKDYGAADFKYHGTIFEIDYVTLSKSLRK